MSENIVKMREWIWDSKAEYYAYIFLKKTIKLGIL